MFKAVLLRQTWNENSIQCPNIIVDDTCDYQKLAARYLIFFNFFFGANSKFRPLNHYCAQLLPIKGSCRGLNVWFDPFDKWKFANKTEVLEFCQIVVSLNVRVRMRIPPIKFQSNGGHQSFRLLLISNYIWNDSNLFLAVRTVVLSFLCCSFFLHFIQSCETINF